MQLVKMRVQNFRSIEDTGVFSINDLTCLVGKNEAGKTAILKALEGQLPLSKLDAKYDLTRDYPRRFYAQIIQDDPEPIIEVCVTYWKIDEKTANIIRGELGPDCLSSSELIIKSYYNDTNKWTLPIDEKKALSHIISSMKFDAAEKSSIGNIETSDQLSKVMAAIPSPTDKHKALIAKLKNYRSQSVLYKAIDLISPHLPKFFYASHYDRMSGQVSIDQMTNQRAAGQTISKSDSIFESFLSLAGTSVKELKESKRQEDLKAKCEAASNNITEQIFKYWTQNDALDVQIDISTGKPEDEPPFNTGTVVSARVWNGNHKASVPFSERSAGFVWFFSFLVQFATIKSGLGNIIILLDEPGLTLHGKAQSDLLRYIEVELLPKHQVIYTTHSPFLVPADRFDDVRIVEDILIYKRGSGRPEVKGTKVSEDVLSTDKDTLFPLQGALGYDLCQSLFIGKHTLLVEGPSDILYLQALSSVLRQRGRIGLDPRWTMCPSGGIDKIQPFVSLFSGAGSQLDIAVLTDQGSGDKSKVEKLKRSNLLKAGSVYSIADFTSSAEADIEDLFSPQLYVDILNACYELSADNRLSVEKLMEADTNTTRIVKKAEAAFRIMPTEVKEFDHFAPSAWLIRNVDQLVGDDVKVLDTLGRAEKVFAAFNSLL